MADNASSFSVTPQQYQTLLSALKANPHTGNLKLIINGGSASYDGASFAWAYDGTANLVVTITHKGGLSRFVPDSTIFSEIKEQFLAIGA